MSRVTHECVMSHICLTNAVHAWMGRVMSQVWMCRVTVWMCHVTRINAVNACWWCLCATRLIHMCEMTPWYHVWHDSFICVTWRLRSMCDMTHSYVRHDSYVRVTWLIHTCEITHHQTTMRHPSSIRVPCRLHMCDTTCSYVQHDSFTRVTWLIQAWPASGHDPLGPREPQVVYTHICIYLYLYRTLIYTQIYIHLYLNRTPWTLAKFR